MHMPPDDSRAFGDLLADRLYDAATLLRLAAVPTDVGAAVTVTSRRMMKALSFVLLDPVDTLGLLDYTLGRSIDELQTHAQPALAPALRILVEVQLDVRRRLERP